MRVSSDASWGKMPLRRTSLPGSAVSSWSVASISASSFKVSTGGPLSRNASERSPSVLVVTACTARVRVRVSGLYCKPITRRTAPVAESTRTIPPLSRRGEFGKEVIVAEVVTGDPKTLRRQWPGGWQRRRRLTGMRAIGDWDNPLRPARHDQTHKLQGRPGSWPLLDHHMPYPSPTRHERCAGVGMRRVADDRGEPARGARRGGGVR